MVCANSGGLPPETDYKPHPMSVKGGVFNVSWITPALRRRAMAQEVMRRAVRSNVAPGHAAHRWFRNLGWRLIHSHRVAAWVSQWSWRSGEVWLVSCVFTKLSPPHYDGIRCISCGIKCSGWPEHFIYLFIFKSRKPQLKHKSEKKRLERRGKNEMMSLTLVTVTGEKQITRESPRHWTQLNVSDTFVFDLQRSRDTPGHLCFPV